MRVNSCGKQAYTPIADTEPELDDMTRITIRETAQLLMVAAGVVCTVSGILVALPLLCARTEHGVVELHSTLIRGEPTNLAIIVWGSGVVLHLKPGDLTPPPKVGDPVTLLAIGKTGMLRSGRSFRRAWTWAGGLAVAGVALIIGGLYVLRHQPTPHGHKEEPNIELGRSGRTVLSETSR